MLKLLIKLVQINIKKYIPRFIFFVYNKKLVIKYMLQKTFYKRLIFHSKYLILTKFFSKLKQFYIYSCDFMIKLKKKA